MDGGVRRGADIVKAICLGARAVLCGRAYAYGLAGSGEAGVAQLWRSCSPTSSARYGCWGALRSPRWIVRT
jgi:glutamate synthase domain-containing protein 2